jgi:hypothetical protein
VTTQAPDVPGVLATRIDHPIGPVRPAGATPWWRRPWVLLQTLIVAAFFVNSVPRYLTFDRGQSLIRPDPRFGLHYPLLIAHVLCGIVALTTVSLQVWPWLRQHHPAVHRWSGRVYVFAGVVPTALLALAITPFSSAPAGHTVASILWLTTTITGYRMARQRRYAEHRRWMIYSFALAMQITWGRVMLRVLPLVPGYDARDPHTLGLVLETASWIGFVINLLAAQWWLERTARRSAARPA